MELLLVIGIISILAAVVISAVNPQKQLCDTQNSKRLANAREIKNSLVQYLIDNGEYPTTIPTGANNATNICAYAAADKTGCLDFDLLITQNFLVSLEADPDETDVNLIGYEAYVDGPIVQIVPTRLCVTTGYSG